MNICFFSDSYTSNFKPLTLTRPLDDFRFGIFTIREKWINLLKPSHWVRQIDNYLSQIFPTGTMKDLDDYVWINSRFLPTIVLINSIQNLKPNNSLTWNDQLIAVRLSADETQSHIKLNSIPTLRKSCEVDFSPPSLQYFWDLLSALI